MEISLFQLLILLLLFFPLIKRVFDSLGNKEESAEEAEYPEDPWSAEQHPYGRMPQEEPERGNSRTSGDTVSRTAAGTSHTSQRDTGPTSRRSESRTPSPGGSDEHSWEDFFEGLESVLSGKESEVSPEQKTREQPREYQSRDASAQTGSAAQTAASRQAESHRHPSHGPVYSGESTASQPSSPRQSSERRSSTPRDPYSHDSDTGSDLGEQVSRELEEGGNPIYATLDESLEVAKIGAKGRKNVKRILKHPEKLRDGIILKEILDLPISRRRHYHRF